jgi:cytochrome c peroxidase
MFVPPAAARVLTEGPGLIRTLQTQGLVEIILGFHLAIGLLTRGAAACAGLLLMAFTISVGWTPIGVRDIGLCAAAIAVFAAGPGAFSIEVLWTRGGRLGTFPRGAWTGAMAIVLAVFLLRPERATTVAPEVTIVDASAPFRPIPASVEVDERKIPLGQMLFHDTRLSECGTVSCASCHSADFFGADGRAVSIGTGGALTLRNAPTVFNSGFNFRQFWDGRARTLEEQIDGPVLSEHEMATSWEGVVKRLHADPRYRRMFEAIFVDGVTADNVKNAIAEFERSLTTPNAPFDRFLLGEESALSPAAHRGFENFRKLGCVSCHHGVNIGGNSFQTMGKMADYFGDRANAPDFDGGRFGVTGDPRDRFVFRVPGLRNVAETAPYFHDGSVASLDEAVRLMARYQLGYDLSEQQVDDLVAFLAALTGEKPRM